MDLRKVKKLIELVEESAIEELEVASGDESIRIVLPRGRQAAVTTPTVVTAALEGSKPAVGQVASGDAMITVDAPMAGTFYRAPHPDAPPFVEVGQRVQAGEVLCIIESMKMMHEIRAAQEGVIAQVCVDNSQPIGTGDTLFKLS
jgi:acetyl-CoA carboxylase biotin carboxyl carrier protein